MRIRCTPSLVAGVLCIAAAPARAQSDDCPNARDLSARVAMPPGTPLELSAGAGSLEVRGVEGLREARVRGRVCASSADLAQRARIRADRDNDVVVVETVTDRNDGQSWPDNSFLRIDLVVEVPRGTNARVNDGSGSAELSGLGDLEVNDGSGELRIEDISGTLNVHDGSGDVQIVRASGPVQVHDGSGDIVIQQVRGTVRIHDGSGSITVDDIGGDFIVSESGSGGLNYTNVRGRVDVPRRHRNH